MKGKWAIFDLDGTLLDYEGISAKAFDTVLSRLGRSFSPELHAAIIGSHHSFWSNHIVESLGIADQLTPNELVLSYHEAVESLFPVMPLMPGAEQLLRALKASRIPVAIATSSASHVVPKKLKYHPILSECVDVVVTGDDPLIVNGKPSPDIFLLAAKRLGCPDSDLHHCVVFEDSPFGVLGGIRAGMHTIALPDTRFLAPDAIARHSEIFNHPKVTVVTSLAEIDCASLFPCSCNK
jgi:HAD superfamily hydrolase (TIGR01509 family)